MLNYIQPGNVITVVTPAGGMLAGVAYVINKFFGVANATSIEAAQNELSTTGVYEFTGTGAFGDIAYFNNTTKAIVGASATGLFAIGNIVGTSTGKVQVRLSGNPVIAIAA